MLFVLTGDIQIGKTRWLQEAVAQLEACDVACEGVLAPGEWKDWREVPVQDRSEQVDANGFEKLGINNELLPDHELVAFARRHDLARLDGTYDPGSQSAAAGLGWSIDDSALQRVNEHFASLATRKLPARPGLLVVDELGRLELLGSMGLIEAVRLLEGGPSERYAHALIIVREALLDQLEGRFSAWGKRCCISPDKAGREQLMATFDLSESV